MRLSIVTPSYNQCDYLRRTMRSVLSQAGEFELQWIVVDGGSTDGSAALLQSVDDPRLKWISESDRGQAHAINKGLALADGDVLAWLNSDDLYLPGALAAVAEALTRNPDRRWLVGRCQIIDAHDQPIRDAVTRYKDRALACYSRKALLRQNMISQPAVFWRREFFREVGPLDESLHWTMDYDLWLRMSQRQDPLVIDRVLAQFRIHPLSKTGRLDRGQFDEQFAVACRYFDGDRVSRLIHRFNVEKIVWAYRMMRMVGY